MNVKIYKCFIGSPSDTEKERGYCKEVIKNINDTIGEKFNFRLESLMWEDNSRPSFGEDAQEVINRQLLLKEYEIFIGIMWSKFGSPTKRAESGTIEEFEDAYKKFKDKKDIEICLYFNTTDIPQKDINLDQITKVFEFKKRASELGGLYHEYSGAIKFKENLQNHLTNYLLSKHETLSILKNEQNTNTVKEKATTAYLLDERLNQSLSMFNGKRSYWIDPILSKTNLITSNYNETFKSRANLENIINDPASTIIKSPPLFGLTSLAHHLVLKSWEKNSIWIYLDANKIKRNALDKEVTRELKNTFNSENPKDIKCIVLDSWKNTMHGGMKILKGLSTLFPEIPIIVMQTIDASGFLQEPESEKIDRSFEVLHLLALPKTEIRKLVSSYNKEVYIDEEDKVVNKIVLDLDTLNIHRTAMNCLTLLKVSEKYFDEKTINRTDMLDKVLYILFDLNNLPTYQTIPDVKDCEFVLGHFSENILKHEKYHFSKADFISFSKKVCEDNYIDLDINILFDILYLNGIIIDRFNEFTFRSTYWLFYFAAHRMHADKEFCDFIFESGNYANYPEIIEFYTGIDRRRTDALEILNKDLMVTYDDVHNKLGLPKHIDPYLKIEWNPSEESIEKVRNQISENVQSSNLPTQIKDQHSDSYQDQFKPYDQGIRTILNEYSLAILMRKIIASSRALRNSDYAEANIKKELLNSITLSFEQVAKALMIMTPELASNGRAAYAGQSFNLDGDFGDTVNKRINRILQEIPNNVVRFFKDDINSEKLGPLLIEKINNEKIQLNEHILIVLLSRVRPTGWRIVVEKYIKHLPKNSFYLFNMMGQLRHLYLYDYLEDDNEVLKLKQLIQLGYSKHHFGDKKPSKEALMKFTHSLLKKPQND